jgi:hypothetical protein
MHRAKQSGNKHVLSVNHYVRIVLERDRMRGQPRQRARRAKSARDNSLAAMPHVPLFL